MIKFVVEENGMASLYVDDYLIGQVRRFSGIEILEVFNKVMAYRKLPYRMHSDYSLLMEMLLEKNHQAM